MGICFEMANPLSKPATSLNSLKQEEIDEHIFNEPLLFQTDSLLVDRGRNEKGEVAQVGKTCLLSVRPNVQSKHRKHM